MASCESCKGCSSCSGCGGSLSLTEGELAILDQLAQYSFLPVARKTDDMIPVYLEASDRTVGEYSQILQHLEAKGLILIDYSGPLIGANMDLYKGFPVYGTLSLTQRGQLVLELLDTQGIEE